MIKIDENDPVGEVDPSFPFRNVVIKKNTDMKQFYDLQKEIGRGKFGTVYRCTEKSTGLKLAAKFINTSKRQDRRNAEREVEIMKELQHPRLIQIYDAYEIHNTMCVVLELIEGGELFERVIDDDFVLTEKSVSVFMKQICEGVAFIHSKNILHLDMKPENILCLSRNGNRIKIIDFGLARKYDPEKKMQVLFGTPEFVAPEVVNFDSIGYGTDMWSVGVICYVLLSGLSPFMGETDVQTMANVTIAQYDFEDEAFNDISKDAKDFISRLLIKDREIRMSATDCLSHDWLRRRNVESSCNDLVSQEQQTQRSNELEYQRDTLRNIVDRWNDDAHVISVPAIANGESVKKSKSDKSKLTDTTASANPEVKTNQPGHKPKTKIIIKTKKIKKKDVASCITSEKEDSAAKLSRGKEIVDASHNLVKSTAGDEILVNARKSTPKTAISNQEEKTVPANTVKLATKIAKNFSENLVSEAEKTSEFVIPGKKDNTVPSNTVDNKVGLQLLDVNNAEITNTENKKQICAVSNDIRTTTDGDITKKQIVGRELKNSPDDGTYAHVNGKETSEIKTDELKTISTLTESNIGPHSKPVSQKKGEMKSPTTLIKSIQIPASENELKASSTIESDSNIKEVRKSPVRKTLSPDGKKKKIVKTTSPKVTPKTKLNSTSEICQSENSSVARLSTEQEEKQPAKKFVTTITETVKSIFTRSLSKEGNSLESNKLTSGEIEAADPNHGKSIHVEVNDDSYKSIKKCTFIIKNITPSENKDVNKSQKEAKTSHPNSATSSSDEDLLAPSNNVALRRRISDITSLLSRGGHTNRSADEMASLRDNLSQLLHTRQDSLSKSLSCGESGSFVSKRPKFRISYFSRDVPLTNTMTNCRNVTNLISPSVNGEDATILLPSHKTANHSDPGSLRTSPEPFGPPSLSRKQLSRFFSDSMGYDLPSDVPSSSPNSMTKDKLTELIS